MISFSIVLMASVQSFKIYILYYVYILDIIFIIFWLDIICTSHLLTWLLLLMSMTTNRWINLIDDKFYVSKIYICDFSHLYHFRICQQKSSSPQMGLIIQLMKILRNTNFQRFSIENIIYTFLWRVYFRSSYKFKFEWRTFSFANIFFVVCYMLLSVLSIETLQLCWTNLYFHKMFNKV